MYCRKKTRWPEAGRKRNITILSSPRRRYSKMESNFLESKTIILLLAASCAAAVLLFVSPTSLQVPLANRKSIPDRKIYLYWCVPDQSNWIFGNYLTVLHFNPPLFISDLPWRRFVPSVYKVKGYDFLTRIVFTRWPVLYKTTGRGDGPDRYPDNP